MPSRAPASLPELRTLAAKDPRVVLHLDSADVCALMADSDIAIGAAGTTSWERCCLGLPTVMLVLAENQTVNAQTLARLGAAELLPGRNATELSAALRRLAHDAAARSAMSREASAVIDGGGAPRVANALMNKVSTSQVSVQ